MSDFYQGTSMYYVSTKGGGRGSAKCLLLLTWGEGGLRGHAYVIIFWIFFALDRKITKKSCKKCQAIICKQFIFRNYEVFQPINTFAIKSRTVYNGNFFIPGIHFQKIQSCTNNICTYIDAFEQKKKYVIKQVGSFAQIG